MSDIFEQFGTDNDPTKSMSREEKKEFIRKLIHEEQPNTRAAFFNPKTHEMINLQDFVRQVGEEEAIEKIVDAIGQADTQSICVTQDQVHELIEKFKKGECSEEELTVLKMISSSIASSDHSQFLQHTMSVIVEIIKFSQEKIHYEPTLMDLLSVFDVLMTVDMINDSTLETGRYMQSGPSVLCNIATDIGNDIVDTWKASCQSVPSDEMIVLGLMSVIKNILAKKDIKFIDANIVSNLMDLESFGHIEDDNEENGSNTEDNSQDDEDKRNLLKQ